jgi:DNA-binding IclR family transcriptional regulator
MVTPFARALALLTAFTPRDRWLGNRALAARTGLPTSTVTRIARSLVLLGYLHYTPTEHKFRLAVPVLALGYAAIANSGLQRAARVHMQAFARQHKVHLNLSYRDRLELIVLESCGSHPWQDVLDPVGRRVDIESSAMGWALLAALPELERDYLLDNVKQRTPPDSVRCRLTEAIAQMNRRGFCTSVERDGSLGVLSTPLRIGDHAPLVLGCMADSSQMSRQRVERELGPRLLAMATSLARTSAPK